MPLRQIKKIPRKPTKDTPLNELFVAKSGNDVRYGINLDGLIYELSAVTTISAPSSGGSGGTTDHGALTGLGDDDHTQYVLRSILTTKGDLLTYSTVVARLGIGSSSQILIPDSTAATGLDWANLVFNNDVLVGNNDEIVTV